MPDCGLMHKVYSTRSTFLITTSNYIGGTRHSGCFDKWWNLLTNITRLIFIVVKLAVIAKPDEFRTPCSHRNSLATRFKSCLKPCGRVISYPSFPHPTLATTSEIDSRTAHLRTSPSSSEFSFLWRPRIRGMSGVMSSTHTHMWHWYYWINSRNVWCLVKLINTIIFKLWTATRSTPSAQPHFTTRLRSDTAHWSCLTEFFSSTTWTSSPMTQLALRMTSVMPQRSTLVGSTHVLPPCSIKTGKTPWNFALSSVTRSTNITKSLVYT